MLKKSLCAVSLLGLLSLTACGGGSGGGTASTGSTESAANFSAQSGSSPADAETIVSSAGSDAVAAGGTDSHFSVAPNTSLNAAVDLGEAQDDALVSVVDEPANGTLVLEVDGTFNYSPDADFTGVDTFTYSVTDAGGNENVAEASLSVAEVSATGSNGFTPVVASSDTRTIFVSSSEGLDTNEGLSINAPVQTLEKAFSLTRDGHPDHVLLKRGDTWTDENLSGVKSGRSKGEPAVVAFYGESGDRPKINVSEYALNKDELRFVNFLGLSIEAYKLNPDEPAFDGDTSGNIRMVGEFESILFEDVKLRFVEFIIQGYDGKTPGDIHVRRSMILDKYSNESSYSRKSRPSGVYMDNSDGLTIEESLWDHNGWNPEVVGAAANMYNHNMYISEKGNDGNKILVRNNIITRGSALGVHGRPGGRYENNFFGRNPIGLQMGYRSGPSLKKGTIAHAFDNVITEGLNMTERGIDACADPAICTGAIWGLQVENLGQADVRVEGNIVSNRLFEYEGFVSGIREDEAAKYSDNIVYRWDSEDQGLDQAYPDPGRTLADYNESLGGERSFEAFIEKARNRGLQEWDERYTADAINDYIREGFGR